MPKRSITTSAVYSVTLALYSVQPAFAVDGYVAAVLSDNCIVTAGRELPDDLRFDTVVETIDYTPEKEDIADKEFDKIQVRSAFGAAMSTLGISAGQEVIKFGFNRIENAVKDAAQDKDFTFQNTTPINLFSILPRSRNNSAVRNHTHYHEIKLNSTLRCLTIVSSITPIFVKNPQVKTAEVYEDYDLDDWEDSWDIDGPDWPTVGARLSQAGFQTTSDTGVSTVFEVRLDFSPDMSLAKFSPLYYTAQHFADKDGKPSTDEIRLQAVSLKLKKPQDPDSLIMSRTFTAPKVEFKNEGKIIVLDGYGLNNGVGPDLMPSFFGETGWTVFNAQTPEVPSTFVDFLKSNEIVIEDDFPIVPVNLEVTIISTKEATKFNKALAKFFDDNNVTDTLSTALIDEIGLKTASQKITAQISGIDSQISVIDAKLTFLENVEDPSTEISNRINELKSEKATLNLKKSLLKANCKLSGDLSAISGSADLEAIADLDCEIP